MSQDSSPSKHPLKWLINTREHRNLVLLLFSKVPSGKTGRYACTDVTLGVDQADTIYFDVPCNGSGFFVLPPNDHSWPSCRFRTTTVSPRMYLSY